MSQEESKERSAIHAARKDKLRCSFAGLHVPESTGGIDSRCLNFFFLIEARGSQTAFPSCFMQVTLIRRISDGALEVVKIQW